jgi:hypothetical protein
MSSLQSSPLPQKFHPKQLNKDLSRTSQASDPEPLNLESVSDRREFISILTKLKASGDNISQTYRLYQNFTTRYGQIENVSDFLLILDPVSQAYNEWSNIISWDPLGAEQRLALLLKMESSDAIVELQELPMGKEYNNIFRYIERYQTLCAQAGQDPSFDEMKNGIILPFRSEDKTTSKLMEWLSLYEESNPIRSIQSFVLFLMKNKTYFPNQTKGGTRR